VARSPWVGQGIDGGPNGRGPGETLKPNTTSAFRRREERLAVTERFDSLLDPHRRPSMLYCAMSTRGTQFLGGRAVGQSEIWNLGGGLLPRLSQSQEQQQCDER
jgi:hypothetical protein